MAGQGNLTSPERPIGDTQRQGVHWGKVAACIGAGVLVIATLGVLATLHWRIADTETDLGQQIHKESKEVRELIGKNATAIGKLEGEVSGLKREITDLKTGVKGIDNKLDKVLESRKAESSPSSVPVKHSKKH